MPENYNEQEPNNMVKNNESHVFHGLDKSRKIAVAVLAGFAVLVFFIGFLNIKRGIYSPFQQNYSATQNKSGNSALNEYCPSGNCRDLSIEDLKNMDTDGDGLSDYDEIYIYKTSPYLEDTDGDGFSDYEEVMSGKDPNCPAGRDCAGDVLFNEYANQVNPGEANNIDIKALNAANNLGLNEGDSGLTEIDAATLRSLLLEAGMEKTLLDQIKDEELLELFQESLREAEQRE